MGNSQSTRVSERMPYLAISPSPLVSMANRPVRPWPNRGDVGGGDSVECYSRQQTRAEVSDRLEDLGQQDNSDQQQRHNSPLSHSHQYQHQNSQHIVDSSQSSLQSMCPLVAGIDDHTSRDSSASLHQQVLEIAKKNSHISGNSCNQCVTHGDMSASYSHPSCVRQGHLVAMIPDQTRHMPEQETSLELAETTLILVEVTDHLSMTESTLGDMVEADQAPGLVDPEDILMERVGALDNCLERSRCHGQGERCGALDRSYRETTSRFFSSTNSDGNHIDRPSYTFDVTSGSDDAVRVVPQVYVDPRTGECHSLVFGSFNGDRSSMIDVSRTISRTHQPIFSPSDVCINSNGMFLQTESFSNVTSRESLDHPMTDFQPDDGVFAGKFGPFDSFQDKDQLISVVQGSPASSENHDVCGRCIESQENHFSEQQCSDGDAMSSTCQQSPLRPQAAASNCVSCNLGVESKLAPICGHNISMCRNHSQSLEAETDSVYRNQCLWDSWCDSCQEFLPATSSCITASGMNSRDSRNSRVDAGQPLCSNCMPDRGPAFCRVLAGPKKEVDDCEIATEDFGLDSIPKSHDPGHRFGGPSSDFGRNISQSQLEALGQLQGLDTGDFHVSSTDHNTTTSCWQTATTSDSGDGRRTMSCVGCCCSGDGRRTMSCVGCCCDSLKCSDEARSPDSCERANGQDLSLKCSDEARSPDSCERANGQDLSLKCSDEARSPDSCERANGQHRSLKCSPTQERFSGPPTRDNKPIMYHECEFDYTFGSQSHSGGQQLALTSTVDSRQSADQWHDGDEHTRSQGDCSDPYKRNYVAYMCCAPEDLSPFGLKFHETLESWGFRVFIAPRDLELTGPKYENMTRWLEERCNGKIIVVLSKNYGMSDECLFLTYFARALDPDSRNRNIIPVLIDKAVEIPNVLKGLSIIKYNYDCRHGWLKKRLVNAIAA